MKLSFPTWMAQFKHIAKVAGLNTDDMEEDKTKFVYYDAGTSPEKAVDRELNPREKTQ